ncbi:acetyltransferase [Sporomusaceae bacterium FL31]|nr:acetyltransferase [Sporomusaceae bacterium FL31]GCE34496.1 acetyltransferase [Sporomusaceae bacterium]
MKNLFYCILKKFKKTNNIEKFINRGLKIGENCNIPQNTIIDGSHCWLISIGNNVTLGERVHILAHDASIKYSLGYAKIGRVDIGNGTFIGAGTIILPNVKIGNNVIVGAGSVVTKDIPDNSVAAGNPAKFITDTTQYMEKHQKMMQYRPLYSDDWTVRKKITDSQKQRMSNDLLDGIGYVE